jgi:hypothetical protein
MRGKPHKAPRVTVRGALASGRGQAATVKPRRDLISRRGRSNPWGRSDGARSPQGPAPPPCVPAPPPRRSAAPGRPVWPCGGASGLPAGLPLVPGAICGPCIRPVLSGWGVRILADRRTAPHPVHRVIVPWAWTAGVPDSSGRKTSTITIPYRSRFSAPCTPGSWLCLRGCLRVVVATFFALRPS